ncbi:MAG: PQQ-binding-like beta-propeller repeat protein [Bacteroidales bacterium]|nr:PQQ-binding-like beta-propeller repeat protein [Bacteroidales bacterium]
MYVIMQGETSNLFRLLGADLPKWKMTFIAYDMKTDQEIWRKQHMASHAFNWITYEPFINFFYAEDKIFVEHDPNGTSASGLTVLDVKNGEKLWECNYTTSETKNSGLTKTYLTPFPAPHPVIYDNLVYVVDKNKNRLSCYQLQTGTLVWESERFSDAQKIPSLFVTEGVVILGLGGAATKNVRLSPASGPVTYSNEYIIKDEYGIMAFDAKSGKKIWDGKSISKSAKDKFDFIAGIEHVNDKLYCATNKNFFIIDPKTGAIKNNIPVAKEKLGDIWGMTFFPEQKKIILNLKNGIIKIDAQNALLEGKIKTPNIPFIPATEYINANCDYEDYAIFVSGDSKKMDFKQFASIDLNNMTIRGTEDAKLLFYQIPHFSDGADFFYKLDGSLVKFYSMK